MLTMNSFSLEEFSEFSIFPGCLNSDIQGNQPGCPLSKDSAQRIHSPEIMLSKFLSVMCAMVISSNTDEQGTVLEITLKDGKARGLKLEAY